MLDPFTMITEPDACDIDIEYWRSNCCGGAVALDEDAGEVICLTCDCACLYDIDVDGWKADRATSREIMEQTWREIDE